MAPSEKIVADEKTIGLYIPQKPPVVMIGKLLEVTGPKTVTSFLIREDNLFCDEGIFREPGLIENIAQSAAAGAGYLAREKGTEPRVGFIGGIRNLRIHKLPLAGNEIRTEITVEHEVFDASVVNGKTFLEGCCIAECELKIFLVNPEKQN
ncbi:MAG: 3-hydroxyacyl-ACP dehydratase [Bacteroidetes bacterium]|nr:3-hydroxyacyl-ACP dehydratase [Bacteroidota bacterium]